MPPAPSGVPGLEAVHEVVDDGRECGVDARLNRFLHETFPSVQPLRNGADVAAHGQELTDEARAGLSEPLPTSAWDEL